MQSPSGLDDIGTTIAPAGPAIINDGQLLELDQPHRRTAAPSLQDDSTTPNTCTQTRPLTSRDVPPLPQEVLVMCFNNLRDDTDTLACLVRTSKHFKEISTPILYGHWYFDDDDTLYHEELFPLAGVTERTPSRANDGGQEATEQLAGAQQSSETQIDDTGVEKDRVGRRRAELQQLTKRLTIRAFDAILSAALSDRLPRDGSARLRGVDTIRLLEHSNYDIHRLFGSNDSYEAVSFRTLLRNLVNPCHFCLEMVGSASQRLGTRNRCSCYDMLVEGLYSQWSRLETITIHTTHLMLDQRRFVSSPQHIRLRIFVALVGGGIEDRLKTDSHSEIDSLAHRTLAALNSGVWGRRGKRPGPIELIFETLDNEQLGVMQARMVKLVQDQPTPGMPAAELLEKGEDGCMKLKGVTLVGGKSSSACTICGGAAEERGAYRKPGSEPCHAVEETEAAQATVIQGHGGVESAEEEQVVSTGDQADDVTTVQGEGEEQDKQTGNEDMPHRTTVEGGQAEVETKQESVSMDTDPGFTDEPVAMEGHSGGGGAPAELEHESPTVDMGQALVDGMQDPACDGGSREGRPVTVDMEKDMEKDMA